MKSRILLILITVPSALFGQLYTPNASVQTVTNGSNNIGIGTGNPRVSLQVDGSSGIQSRLRVSSPFVGCSASYDITMGTADDEMAAGMKAYVPVGQPGFDRVFLGFYTTTYFNGLQSRVERLTITDRGDVGIGILDTKGYKLAVAGKAIAEEIVVKLQGNWPDYVFEPDYKLPSLADVERYIHQNKHLPEVPSAKEVAQDGIRLGELNNLLLKKVEELTLYIIELKKETAAQQKKIDQQQLQINTLLEKL